MRPKKPPHLSVSRVTATCFTTCAGSASPRQAQEQLVSTAEQLYAEQQQQKAATPAAAQQLEPSSAAVAASVAAQASIAAQQHLAAYGACSATLLRRHSFAYISRALSQLISFSLELRQTAKEWHVVNVVLYSLRVSKIQYQYFTVTFTILSCFTYLLTCAVRVHG